jgi:hypothetical protein
MGAKKYPDPCGAKASVGGCEGGVVFIAEPFV